MDVTSGKIFDIRYIWVVGSGKWYWSIREIDPGNRESEIGTARTRLGAYLKLRRIIRNINRPVMRVMRETGPSDQE